MSESGEVEEQTDIQKLAAASVQQQKQIELLTTLVQSLSQNGVTPSVSRNGLEAIEKRIRQFSYDVDEGLTADTWLARHDSIFAVDLKDSSEEEKARILMRHVDDRAYNRIVDDIRPKSLSEMKFEELVKVMKKIFGEKKSVFEKRLDLFKLRMTTSNCTDLREYAGMLNRAFEEAKIKDMSSDQLKAVMFMTGIDLPRFAPTMFHVMNQAKNDTELRLDTLLEVADRFQTVQHDSLAVANQNQVNRIKSDGWRKEKRVKKKTPASVENNKCSSCGRGSHSKKDCPHKEAECFNCHKMGHLAKVCFSGKKTQQSRKQQKSDCCRVIHENSKQADIQVEVNGKMVTMRVDTGSDLTFISESTWSKIGKPECGPSDAFPLCANSTALELRGKCNVTIRLNDISAHGGVYVTHDDVNLLGEDFREFFFDLVPKRQNMEVARVRAIKAASTEYCDMVKSDFPEICEE